MKILLGDPSAFENLRCFQLNIIHKSISSHILKPFVFITQLWIHSKNYKSYNPSNFDGCHISI